MTSCGCYVTPKCFSARISYNLNGILHTTNYMCLCRSYLAAILCDCLGRGPLIARHDWHVWTGWTLGSAFVMSILNIFNTWLFTHSIVFLLFWATFFVSAWQSASENHNTLLHYGLVACTIEGKTKIGVTKLFWGTWIWYVNLWFLFLPYFIKSCILKKLKRKIPIFSTSSITTSFLMI